MESRNAADVLTEIEESAAASTPHERFVGDGNGDAVQQGDVYLERLPEAPSDLGPGAPTRQLAVGSSQGSRHVALGDLKVFSPKKGESPLLGPVVVATERWTLDHPEHGPISLPAGVYRTRFQRDYARERAEEIRRVQD